MGASKENGRGDSFAAILYAEPGALGVIANIMSALVVAIENMLDGTPTTVALSLAGKLNRPFLQRILTFRNHGPNSCSFLEMRFFFSC